MAPEAQINVSDIQEFERNMRDQCSGLEQASAYSGRFRLYNLGCGELVQLRIDPSERTATIKCGQSAAAILEEITAVKFAEAT